jgi:hypothetical protein
MVKRGKPLAHVWNAGKGSGWFGQLLLPGAPPKGPFHDEKEAKRAMERLVENQPLKPKSPPKEPHP